MRQVLAMPQIGESVTEGTVLRWLKNVGDKVRVGDVVLEIESDKAVLPVEAYEEGVLVRQLAKEGDVVPVLSPIADLE